MFIIIAITILYSVYKSSDYKSKLKDNYDFTVGMTTEYSFADGFSDCIEYKYYLNNIKFTGCVKFEKVSNQLIKYYKVKYSKIKPEISEMYLNEEITDSTQVVNAGLKYNKN